MNVVCYEWVCYERGLFWVVCYEWSVLNGHRPTQSTAARIKSNDLPPRKILGWLRPDLAEALLCPWRSVTYTWNAILTGVKSFLDNSTQRRLLRVAVPKEAQFSRDGFCGRGQLSWCFNPSLFKVPSEPSELQSQQQLFPPTPAIPSSSLPVNADASSQLSSGLNEASHGHSWTSQS